MAKQVSCELGRPWFRCCLCSLCTSLSGRGWGGELLEIKTSTNSVCFNSQVCLKRIFQLYSVFQTLEKKTLWQRKILFAAVMSAGCCYALHTRLVCLVMAVYTRGIWVLEYMVQCAESLSHKTTLLSRSHSRESMSSKMKRSQKPVGRVRGIPER